MVDLKAQYRDIRSDIDAAVRRVIERAEFILGPEVAEFEREFAATAGCAGAVGVASGSAALRLALLAVGCGAGDEVITTAHTFVATAEAISLVGATPVFVDIELETYNIDPDLVEAAITARTKAILPVHLYGQPARMSRLREIADRRGLCLIEDAAQAHLAEFDGERCGSFGAVACFSFYPAKNLGAYGDAGAVTSSDDALLARIRRLRDHGRVGKYEHVEIGFGERLDELQAAILRAKLPHLEAWTAARRTHARQYDELLAGSPAVTPSAAVNVRHVYHLYVVRVPRRDDVLRFLHARGIGAGIHYPTPLHRQPAYLQRGFAPTSLPVTERVASEVLSLPMYPELTPGQIEQVARTVREALGC